MRIRNFSLRWWLIVGWALMIYGRYYYEVFRKVLAVWFAR